ncbi:hypothetical protein WA1_14055 [Scytonema hofmannii PCC 7110]|uniref:Helicase C-terminal domain-containing protein n=2 Tax=Scytonema hofmannii TaxID=34078 RepID=A0A139XET6_9CYAN|nr:hypothetical protein WA1_14055 [Scytonema hofmannii PCC 7110]
MVFRLYLTSNSGLNKVIIQAIGRICRTNIKASKIHILADTSIRKHLTKFSLPEDVIPVREYTAILESVNDSTNLIHDDDYYEKMKLEDEYLLSTDTIYRQHLMIESIETISNATLKTTIKELLIKRDISSRTLNLFDWSKLQLTGIWTFAAWDEDAGHVIFMEISVLAYKARAKFVEK